MGEAKKVLSRGIFISLEGIEGCGKTTQAELIKSHLEEKGFSVVLTREPGGTEIAEQIRQILSDSKNKALTSRAELFLFLAARAQHVEEIIKPALKEGKVVISDRFSDATLAYQGYGREIDLNLIDELNRIATGGLEPKLTILLDLPPEAGLTRVKISRNLVKISKHFTDVHKRRIVVFDRIESEELEFHQRVREGYLALARQFPERIKVVKADGPIEEIFETVKGLIESILVKRKT